MHAGALETTGSDRVNFLVGGTTGALVKRETAAICGIVTGLANGAVSVEGLFDLAENRNPIVEAP